MALNYQAAIEAMLFAAGEPVEADKIASVLELKPEAVLTAIETLQVKYNRNESGIRILKLGESYQMCSAKEYIDLIRMMLELKKNTPLSQAAL